MSTYTADGIGALIYKNGKWGPGTKDKPADKAAVIAFLDTAIAVALAESGGNDQAMHRNKDGSTDYGLWQINSVHKDLLKKYTWNNAGDNTEMARQIWESGGRSFRPWTGTYGTGEYKAFLGHGAAVYEKLSKMDKNTGPSTLAQMLNFIPGGGAAAGAALDATGLADNVSGLVTSPFKIAKGILDSVFQFVKEGAIVVGVFLIGIVLLLGGFRLLVQNTEAYRKARGSALQAAKLAVPVA